MNTARELREYCKEHKIKDYSRLIKGELIRLIGNVGPFPFSDELFSEERKESERQIRCDECGKYIRMSKAEEHAEAFHINEFASMQTLRSFVTTLRSHQTTS